MHRKLPSPSLVSETQQGTPGAPNASWYAQWHRWQNYTVAVAQFFAFALTANAQTNPATTATEFPASRSSSLLLTCPQPGTGKPPSVTTGTKRVQVHVVCTPALAASAPAPSQPSASVQPSAPASAQQPRPRQGDWAPNAVGMLAALLSLCGLWQVMGSLSSATSAFSFGDRRPSSSDQVSQRSEGFRFRRHWGGFGGDSAGWDFSIPLMRLLIGLLLLALGLWLWIWLIPTPATENAATEPLRTTQPAANSASATKG